MALDFRPDGAAVVAAASTPDNIGGLTDDGKIKRGKLTDEQRLEILTAQLADPDRNPESEPELQREIAAVKKRLGGSRIDFQAAPAAAQADVRKAEQPLAPLPAQELEERRFGAAMQQWMAATGGKLKPGQTQKQAVTEWSGIADPQETRAKAEATHMAQTGEYVPDDTVAYEATKALATIGGFVLAGPAGATALELGTRYASLRRRMDQAMKEGMSEDEADSILARELAKGITADAALNFGIPVAGQLMGILGQWLAKISGKAELGAKFRAALEKVLAPSMRDAKIDSRVKETTDPVRQEAVREISKRVNKDFLPTPGQVRGEAGITEGVVNKAFPSQFEAQEKAMYDTTEGMRREFLNPEGRPSRQAIGERIVKIADDTVKATKERLRPVFQAADNLNVRIDMSGVTARVKAALAADAAVPTGRLEKVEREHLQKLVADIEGGNGLSAEAALDFISRQKEKLRATTADWKPSEFFDTIMNGIMRDADTAFTTSVKAAAAKARTTGDLLATNRQSGAAAASYGEASSTEKTLTDLLSARKEYRKMMETVFDDSMKQALRKEAGGAPEDIGPYLWQNGKVSRLEQLNELLGLAQGEGKLTASSAAKLQRDVTRSFLQEGVKDVKSAANWSQKLASEPRLADTWKVLTSSPGGAELRKGMEVLEQAAQMSTMRDSAQNRSLMFGIAAGRAATGGLGVSYVTGVIHPGMVALGLTIAGTMKMMATAYTHGDKGALQLMVRVIRARNAGTAASIQALQTGLLPQLERLADKYGVDDLFASAADDAADMMEAPPGYGAVNIPGVTRSQ